MNEVPKIELPVKICFKLFDESFNRVQLFTIIGENIAINNLPNEWGIKNDSGITYPVEPPPEDKKDYVVNGFKHFLQCSLVRDCIESFMLSLDTLYLLLSVNGKKMKLNQPLLIVLTEEERKDYNDFTLKGLSKKDGKIKALKDKFGLELSEENKTIANSLKDIRDCLTHGNGIVNEKYGSDAKDGKRKFTWQAISIFLQSTESKKRYKIEFGKKISDYVGGINGQDSIDVCLEIKERSKDYEIGEQLTFSPAETYEIAWSLQEIGREYIQKIKEKYFKL
jgi:hypothetical protein